MLQETPINTPLEQILFQPTNDSVLLVNEFGMVKYANSRVSTMFGYDRQMMLNAKIALLFPIKYYSVINTYIYRCTQNHLSKTENRFKEFVGTKLNGATFPIEVVIECCEYKNQNLAIIRIIDKTTIKTKVSETEKQLVQFLKQEQEKYQKQEQFVSKTSHELRTPLTTILNATQLLDKCKGQLDCNHIQEKNINRIKDAIVQLTDVMNDFLAINKIKDHKENDLFETEVSSFSNEIIDKLKNRNSAIINYNHCGNSIAVVDRELLSSVFNNLLSNAIKYSPNMKSPIEFHTQVSNGVLTAICKDRGIGIPKDAQHHLFDRYYRAKNTSNIQGTGLGLSIVKEHLSKVGGTINVKSEVNKGATFTVKIPV